MNLPTLIKLLWKKLPAKFLLQLCCNIGFLWISTSASAQKRALAPSGKVVKVGFVDHKRLRAGYNDFANFRQNTAKASDSAKVVFDQVLQTLEQQARAQLREDSLGGGRRRDRILRLAEEKRQALTSSYRADQKNRVEERLVLIQAFEQKIQLVIDRVVTEGGFTDVRPLNSDGFRPRGADITDLILKKLN